MNEESGVMKSRVLVADAGYDVTLAPVIERVLDEFPREWSGKRVLVKPNVLAPFAPEDAVTTHPAVVEQVVKALLARGAEVVVGDNPGARGYGANRNAAEVCGLVEASQGCFANLGQEVVRHPLASRHKDAVAISKEVLAADLVVNLPKLKTHAFTIYTGAIKNTFGYVVGGDKMRVHASCLTPRNFAEALVDIFSVRPPELTIMDAIVGMEGNGPSNGKAREIGKIIAGVDAIAVDAAAVHMIGLTPRDVPHLAIAGQRGLGEADVGKIEIMGELALLEKFRTPNTFIPGSLGVFVNRFLSTRLACDPEVVSDLCKKCGICAKHCPVGAMSMVKGQGPTFKPDDCIHCYCCQELCPEDAIRLSGRMVKIIRRLTIRE